MSFIRKIINGKRNIGKLKEIELATDLHNTINRLREDTGELDLLLNAESNRIHKCNIILYSNPVLPNIGIGGVSPPIYFQMENLRGDYVHNTLNDGTLIYSQVCGVAHIHALLWGGFDNVTGTNEFRLAVYRNDVKWLYLDRQIVNSAGATTFEVSGGCDVAAACGDKIDIRLENAGYSAFNNFTALYGYVSYHYDGDCSEIINLPV